MSTTTSSGSRKAKPADARKLADGRGHCRYECSPIVDPVGVRSSSYKAAKGPSVVFAPMELFHRQEKRRGWTSDSVVPVNAAEAHGSWMLFVAAQLAGTLSKTHVTFEAATVWTEFTEMEFGWM